MFQFNAMCQNKIKIKWLKLKVTAAHEEKKNCSASETLAGGHQSQEFTIN